MVKAPERLSPPSTEAPEPKKISRRHFLRNAAIGGGLLAVGGVGATTLLGSEGSPKKHTAPVGKKGSKEPTPTTLPEELTSEEKQIEKIAKSIEATYKLDLAKLGQYHFTTGDTPGEFNFPELLNGVGAQVDTNTAHFLDNKIIYPSGFQIDRTPNLGPIKYFPEEGRLDTLAVNNGTLVTDLKNSEGGQIVLSFGTTMFPDGKMLTLILPTNIVDPNNPDLQSTEGAYYGKSPTILKTAGQYEVGDAELSYTETTREGFILWLKSLKGRPFRISLWGDRFRNFNQVKKFPGLDLFNPTIEAQYRAVLMSWFNGDALGFAQGASAGEQADLFITPQTTNIVEKIRKISVGLTDSQTVLQHYPLAIPMEIPQSKKLV